MQRVLLTNTTLLIAEQKNAKEEGWFDGVTKLFEGRPKTGLNQIGTPVINLPFSAVMDALKITDEVANKLVNDVTGEVSRALVLCAKIPVLNMVRPEGSIGTGAPVASKNEIAFLENLAPAVGGPKEEGWFIDVGNLFKEAANNATTAVFDGVKIVGGAVDGAADTIKEGVTKGVDGALDAAQKATGFVNRTADKVVDKCVDLRSKVPVAGELFGTAIRGGTQNALLILDMVNKITQAANES